ncbi:uncharacterized protein VTP21DRAFT_8498 [Calcarisporiella thermophila]|uniref:uncharacterized protein n=1 Tax=Calcarisporiella thermophila TaxID=911321 RepID=UPI0037445796
MEPIATTQPNTQVSTTAKSSHLKELKVSALLDWRESKGQKPTLVAVSENTTMEKMLEILREQNLQAIPIHVHSAPTAFLGIISVLDLVTISVFQPLFDELHDELQRHHASGPDKKIHQILREGSAFFERPVGSLTGFTSESAGFLPRRAEEDLKGILQYFAEGNHQILVLGGNGPQMLTQIDVLQWALENRELFPSGVFDTSIDILVSMGRCSPEHYEADYPTAMVTIHESTSAFQAFKAMFTHKCSAIAIVNDDGKFAGNVSGADLRGFNKENAIHFLSPVESTSTLVKEFIQKVHGVDCLDKSLCIQDANMTLLDLSRRILDKKVHRAFLLDSLGRPSMMITLTDIIATLFNPISHEE